MKWALVNENNLVTNVVVHNPESNWQPPEAFSLVEVNDWVNIGDQADKEAPAPSQEPTPEELKLRRNEAYNTNIALLACYEIEMRTEPQLTFSDYLDRLERLL